jgi:hypothetical protein
MIRIYCRARHGTKKNQLCGACSELLAYAEQRIAHCPFGADKPVCNQCPVHCYQTEMRARIKSVMGYAGPRMIWQHPVLALRHVIRSSASQ